VTASGWRLKAMEGNGVGRVLAGAGLLLAIRVPRWVGTLVCVGGLAFPAGQIMRVEWLASGVDLLLLVPFAFLARAMAHEAKEVVQAAWSGGHDQDRGVDGGGRLDGLGNSGLPWPARGMDEGPEGAGPVHE